MNDNLLTLLVDYAQNVLDFHENGYLVTEGFRPRYVNALANLIAHCDWADACLLANDADDEPNQDFVELLKTVSVRDGIKVDYFDRMAAPNG